MTSRWGTAGGSVACDMEKCLVLSQLVTQVLKKYLGMVGITFEPRALRWQDLTTMVSV